MIILPKYLIKPPGNISQDELVEAAYNGISINQLAKERNIRVKSLYEYVKKVWPRYFEVYRKARKFMDVQLSWEKRILAVINGEMPLRNSSKGIRSLFFENFPTYLWNDKTGRLILRYRPAAGVDLAMLSFYQERLNKGWLISFKKDKERSIYIRNKLDMTSNYGYDLLMGFSQSKNDKRIARNYIARRIREGRPIGSKRRTTAKRKYWEELGRKLKDYRQPEEGDDW